jgi:DNA polymerase elongation subunit (family B)
MEGDFESEYPSIIISCNISPETLVTDPTMYHKCNKYVINYRSGMNTEEERYVYFLKKSEQLGIFPQLCSDLLEQRRQSDK